MGDQWTPHRYRGFDVRAEAEQLSASEWVARAAIGIPGDPWNARTWGLPVTYAPSPEAALAAIDALARAEIDRIRSWANRSSPLGAIVRCYFDTAGRGAEIDRFLLHPDVLAAVLEEANFVRAHDGTVELPLGFAATLLSASGEQSPRFAEAHVHHPGVAAIATTCDTTVLRIDLSREVAGETWSFTVGRALEG
jgi:hypothetical protein